MTLGVLGSTFLLYLGSFNKKAHQSLLHDSSISLVPHYLQPSSIDNLQQLLSPKIQRDPVNMAPEKGKGKEIDSNTFGIGDLSLTPTPVSSPVGSPVGSLYNMTRGKRKKDGIHLAGGTFGNHSTMTPQGEDDIYTASPKKRRKRESSSAASELSFAQAQAESSGNPGSNEGKEKQKEVDEGTFSEGIVMSPEIESESCMPNKKWKGKQNEIVFKRNIGERIHLLKNKHINSMDFYDKIYLDWMREIQGVYSVAEMDGRPQVPLEESSSTGIRLMWDHDRLWGYFQFRAFEGYFLVDPGPGEELFQAIDEQNAPFPHLQHRGLGKEGQLLRVKKKGQEQKRSSIQKHYPLVWRGKHKDMPNTIFNSSCTTGEIRFGHWEIEGYFAAMDGAGLPDNKLKFRAQRTSEGGWTLSSAIDGWNKYRTYNKKEWPRSGIDVEDEADREIGRLMANMENLEGLELDLKDKCDEWIQAEKQEWWKQLLSFVQGDFTASGLSNNTENSHDQELVMRFNVPDRGETIWGRFSIASSKGHLRCDFPTVRDFSKTERRFLFNYRAKENPNAKTIEGTCEITFSLDGTIEGYFCPTINGNVSYFQGKARPAYEGFSGDPSCDSQGWNSYRPGLEVARAFMRRH